MRQGRCGVAATDTKLAELAVAVVAAVAALGRAVAVPAPGVLTRPVTRAWQLRLTRHSGRLTLLFALAVLLAAGEAIVLYAIGFSSALPLAPQIVAPPPLGAYHDLRWVFTFSWSWLSFGLQLAALLVVRTLLSSGFTLLAWPEDAERPGFPVLLGRSAAGTLIAVVALSPWAALAFASGVVSYGWFMVVSIVAVAGTAVVTPAVAVAGAWWRRRLPWQAMLASFAAWFAVMIAAIAISYAPGWLAVLAAAAGGAVSALLWRWQVVTVVHAPARRTHLPVAPIAVLGVIALVLVGGGFVFGGPTGGAPSTGTDPRAEATAASVGLLYVPGHDSSYDGGSFTLLGTRAWHYSYAGLAGDHPAPYGDRQTYQPLPVSAARLAAQVTAVHRQTGADVVLLAESEGTLVVRHYLDTHPHPPVRMFIEVSPLMRAGRGYFPPPGQSGYGIAAGWEMRELLSLIHLEHPGFDETADEPFIRSVVDHAGVYRGTTMCPADVPEFALVPFEAALTVYNDPASHVRWTAVPGYHASLLATPTVQHDVLTLIHTGRLPHHAASTTAFPIISAAASAWQAPALPLRLRSEWHTDGGSDPAFSGWRCPTS